MFLFTSLYTTGFPLWPLIFEFFSDRTAKAEVPQHFRFSHSGIQGPSMVAMVDHQFRLTTVDADIFAGNKACLVR